MVILETKEWARVTFGDCELGDQRRTKRLVKRAGQAAARLERVTGLLSVVAVRLPQLKTAARETPDRPALEVAPAQRVTLVQIVRKKAVNPWMTLREFLRAVAGLGGHLGRNSDGEPGWMALIVSLRNASG